MTQNSRVDDSQEFETPEYVDIIKKTVATGSVNPRKEIVIKPQVSGVIEELYVEAGDLVKKGQRIARIKLIPSQVNINSANNSVELSKLRLKDAERELRRQQEMATSNLDINEARLRYENAKAEYERNSSLYKDGVISERDFLQFQTDYELRQAAFENTKVSAQNALKQFEVEVDVRRQELDAAIDNLQLLKEGASKKSKLVANIVNSTVDGMVLEVPIKVGGSVIERNNFNEGSTIATVADMNSLLFEGKIDESDVGKLRVGMDLLLTVGAIEDQTFDAKLEFISPKGVTEDGTVKFEIKAALSQQGNSFLRAGYSCTADIILDQRENVLSIKERDVIYNGDTTTVEIRNSSDQLEEIDVELGLSDGIHVEVLSGVDSTHMILNRKNM